jgi:hypothetical protein
MLSLIETFQSFLFPILILKKEEIFLIFRRRSKCFFISMEMQEIEQLITEQVFIRLLLVIILIIRS